MSCLHGPFLSACLNCGWALASEKWTFHNASEVLFLYMYSFYLGGPQGCVAQVLASHLVYPGD